MIRVTENSRDYGINVRIAEEPRLSKAQKDAIRSAAEADSGATVEGLDSYKNPRPVVTARLPGPRKRVRYALLRNGEPTKVTSPLAEVWR